MTAVGSTGRPLSYADGAEERLLRILEGAKDRSSTSDELAGHIVDWPSRYHLSRLRSNLLRPLDVRPGMRVLEIGCGTGVNLRYLAERGANVVGVEGSPLRAQCARERCRGLPGVEVLSGDIFSFEGLGEFDLVLLIGVLEYSAAASGGERGPMALLELVESLLTPEGSLVIAIENQLGLKYLLGYREDHHALPWVGLDDYATVDGARTWSRRSLSQMLDASGLSSHEWFYPFPDYKLPTFIAADRIFETEQGREVLSRFLLQPVVDHSGQPAVVADPAGALRVFLDAGLGRDVSNSFMIVASRPSVRSSAVVREPVAWQFSAERQSRFLTRRVILDDGDGFTIESAASEHREVNREWLMNQGHTRQPVLLDQPPLVSMAIGAWSVGDHDVLRAVWAAYESFLSSTFADVDGILPEGPAVDCTLSNLVGLDPTVFVDQEWFVTEPIPRSSVVTRALVDLALRIVRAGRADPAHPSVLDVMRRVGDVVGLALTDDDIERFTEFESRFQSSVVGGSPRSPDQFREVLGLTVGDMTDPVVLTSLRVHLRNLEQHTAGLEQHTAGLEQHAAGLEAVIAGQRGELEALRSRLEEVEYQRDAVEHARTIAEEQCASIRSSTSFRLGNLLIRPVHRAWTLARPKR